MEEYQKIVVVEKEELDTKITDLNTYIAKNQVFKNIKEEYMKELLKRQLEVMIEYSNILGVRIENFSD